jgi:hypothetical protein
MELMDRNTAIRVPLNVERQTQEWINDKRSKVIIRSGDPHLPGFGDPDAGTKQ